MRRTLLLLVVVAAPALAGDSQRLKEYFSPDRRMVARVLTRSGEKGSNAESNIEFRSTSDGRLIGARSFMTKDRRSGLGVVKALWSPDSQFFVFSTVSSGGRQPGLFPTFVFSRAGPRIILLDATLKVAIVSPEFTMDAPDAVTFTVRENAAAAERTVRLSELRKL